jgi:hypothetical protein
MKTQAKAAWRSVLLSKRKGILDGVIVYKPDTLILPRWEVVLHIAVQRDRKVQWFPLRSLCAVLGISWPSQLEVIKRTPRLEAATRTISLKTEAGMRSMLCMKRPELALWLGGIDARRISEKFREQLEEFQVELMNAADQLLWPGNTPAPVEKRGVLSHAETEEIVVACLECGTVHRVVKVDGKYEVTRTGGAR